MCGDTGSVQKTEIYSGQDNTRFWKPEEPHIIASSNMRLHYHERYKEVKITNFILIDITHHIFLNTEFTVLEPYNETDFHFFNTFDMNLILMSSLAHE
jgi:murein tripeptide amidase MpaA